MVFLQGERNRSSGSDSEFSICPSLHLAHWLQHPHPYGSPPVGVKVQQWQRWWFPDVVTPSAQWLMSQEDCSAAPILVPGHFFLLEKAGPGLLSSSQEFNSQFPISCFLPPGLHLPPSDLHSVVLRPLASGEASRDPLAVIQGNRLVSEGHGWVHEPWVKTWAVHSESTSLHKTELLALGPLLWYKNQKMGSPLFLYLFSSISLKLGLMVLIYSTFMILKRRRKSNRLFS